MGGALCSQSDKSSFNSSDRKKTYIDQPNGLREGDCPIVNLQRSRGVVIVQVQYAMIVPCASQLKEIPIHGASE